MFPGMNRLFLEIQVWFNRRPPGFRSKLWLYDPGTGGFRGDTSGTVQGAETTPAPLQQCSWGDRWAGPSTPVDVIASEEVESGLL